MEDAMVNVLEFCGLCHKKNEKKTFIIKGIENSWYDNVKHLGDLISEKNMTYESWELLDWYPEVGKKKESADFNPSFHQIMFFIFFFYRLEKGYKVPM